MRSLSRHSKKEALGCGEIGGAAVAQTPKAAVLLLYSCRQPNPLFRGPSDSELAISLKAAVFDGVESDAAMRDKAP